MTTIKFPFEDAQLQRQFEEVYRKMGKDISDRNMMLADLQQQLASLRERIATAEASRPVDVTGNVLPIPQNLNTVKVGFFGFASVTPFKLASYPGLLGYEFYADDTTGFTPISDRLTSGFNLASRGALPWCIYWCGLTTNDFYVLCRTFGRDSVSAFADEASTSDKPDTPADVRIQQQGDVYYPYPLGQPRVDIKVSWEESLDPYVIGYDVKLVDEGEY